MKILITPIDFHSGVYEGSAFASVIARYNGKLTKFKVDPKFVDELQNSLDKEVEVDIVLSQSVAFPSSVKIVGFTK